MKILLVYTFALLGSVMLTIVTDVKAESWYEASDRKCDLQTQASDTILSPYRITKTQHGGMYFTVPKSEINMMLTSGHGGVSNKTLMSASNLSALKANLISIKDSKEEAITAFNLVTGEISFEGVTGKVIDNSLDWLTSSAQAKQASLEAVIDLITSGGESVVTSFLRFPASGFKPYLMQTKSYAIQVGTEANQRRYILSTCFLPIEIIFKEFETVGGGNEKKLIIQPDGTWRLWDVTDAKYSPVVIDYQFQDEYFAYFNAQDGGKRYRFHMYDGPFEVQDGESSIWKTLYLKTKSN